MPVGIDIVFVNNRQGLRMDRRDSKSRSILTVNIPHFLHKIPPQFTPQTEYLTKKYLEKYLTC